MTLLMLILVYFTQIHLTETAVFVRSKTLYEVTNTAINIFYCTIMAACECNNV